MLTKDQILNGTSFLPFRELEVPELGGTVGIQGMTAGQAIDYHRELAKLGDDPGVEGSALLIVRSLVDEKRERIFADDQWEAIITGPRAWPISAVNRVAMAAMELNGASVEGNSEATPDSDSSSD